MNGFGVLEQFYSNHRKLALAYNIATGRLWRPSHLKVIATDLFAATTISKQSNDTHIRAALRWLREAQKSTGVGGISAGYYFNTGWGLPYPEISGYMIPTLINSGSYMMAMVTADWLIGIQNSNGSFNTGFYNGPDVRTHRSLHLTVITKSLVTQREGIFETGQILWGLVAAYESTGEAKYLDAAVKAGEWLKSKQESDGTWIEIVGAPRVWSSLTASHLIRLAKITKDETYEKAAIRQIEWCLTQQMASGWFTDCSQTTGNPDYPPWTHGIGYTLQGILEAGMMLGKQKYIDAVIKTAEVLLRIYSLKGFKTFYNQKDGFLPARFNSKWKSGDTFSCLVGNAQISWLWSTIYMINGDYRYLNAAVKINEHLKSLQSLDSSNPGIRGGIKGSHPVWGLYCTFSYPAWATKFFIDALLAEDEAIDKLRGYR